MNKTQFDVVAGPFTLLGNFSASLTANALRDTHLIGKSGFGEVYKCLIDNGSETFAIKRLKSNSKQWAYKFLTEIETFSELRHVNLVSLIEYCNEHQDIVLVYECMPNGTFADHLYNGTSCSSSLAWKQRLDTCIGAGRGLDCLHTGNAIIHSHVKVSNILSDENFMARVSDFGLVKHENRQNPQRWCWKYAWEIGIRSKCFNGLAEANKVG
ncbi:putative receptor-like protein kinase At5g39000 [Primulina tabacum]|uniref:putative receptor-like protein kinase At5g39000 n=1 Tax=Primulina tabacum TaxID=48773 RepID=UPI003F59715E